jgi:excisionase family DNA binding protein
MLLIDRSCGILSTMHRRRRKQEPHSPSAEKTGEPELLDIQQAAALLQVSPASLRRWTNTGQLTAFRIGGRRERRFRRSDLLALLESRPHGPEKPARHLFGFYHTDLGRVRLAAGSLLEGLGLGALCVLVGHPEVQDQVVAALQRERPASRKDIEAGRLILTEYVETGAKQIGVWESIMEPAVSRGERALWAVGDVTGGELARRGSIDDVLAYEAEFDRVMSRFPLTTFCLYDARTLSGVEASLLWRFHQDEFTSPIDQLVN